MSATSFVKTAITGKESLQGEVLETAREDVEIIENALGFVNGTRIGALHV